MRDYRVDATSNFNNEAFAEKTVLDLLTKDQAEGIAQILNGGLGEGSSVYYQSRHKSERLWRGVEEFI